MSPSIRATQKLCTLVSNKGRFEKQEWRRVVGGLSGFDDDVHRLLISPSDSNRLYLSTRAGLLLSEDAGKSWQPLSMGETKIGYPDALLLHPKRENVMFTGSSTRPPFWPKKHTADSKIARSRDGGKSWEVVRNGLPEHIRGNIEAMAMDICNGSFSLFAGTTDGEIFHSDDCYFRFSGLSDESGSCRLDQSDQPGLAGRLPPSICDLPSIRCSGSFRQSRERLPMLGRSYR